MKFAVVTCTGGRPELFALCQRWVLRQTRQPDLWIVVTDTGEKIEGLPSFARFSQVPPMPESFSGPRYLQPAWSLFYALGLVPEDHAAVIMEDDDWYSRHHCATIMKRLEAGAQISYGRVVWRFHVPAQRYRVLEAVDPTEGNVGIHPSCIGAYVEGSKVVPPTPRWNPADGVYEGFTKVDIKGVGHGLPGRCGVTNHHDPVHKKGRIMRPDPGNQKLVYTIGAEDAAAYIRLVQR